jgi:hypothetical protein
VEVGIKFNKVLEIVLVSLLFRLLILEFKY